MQFLIDFAEENEEFLSVLRRAAEYPVVQGVVLDVDRYWLWTWQAYQQFGDRYVEQMSHWLPVQWFISRPYFSEWAPIYVRPIDQRDIDGWRPPHWERYCQLIGLREGGLPLVVKICLRPRTSEDEAVPTIEQLSAATGRLRVQIEGRSQAELCSNPRKEHRPVLGGVSIGVTATDYGTLCIVLEDHAGSRFGLTCSHVVQTGGWTSQPAPYDNKNTKHIGRSALSTTLTKSTSATLCNPWSGISANELDASLIQIDSSTVKSILEVLGIGALSGIAPRASISTGQGVEVTGRTTKYSSLQVGGLAAWYHFKQGNEYFCFKNLFEVESPFGAARPIKKGDSGAPVCISGSAGTEWCGMITACDRNRGFAIYSESLEAWWLSQGYNLRPL